MSFSLKNQHIIHILSDISFISKSTETKNKCGAFEKINEIWEKVSPEKHESKRHHLVYNLKSMKLKNIDRSPTVGGESVMDEKFILRFQTSLQVFGISYNVSYASCEYPLSIPTLTRSVMYQH